MPVQAQANPGNSPVHVQCFSHLNGEHTILMSFGDIIIFQLMHLGIGYKRKVHKSLRAVVWASGTEWLGQLLRGHQPSTLALLVPLMEQEYIPVEWCAYLFTCMCPELFWTPVVSVTLVVC